MEGASVNITQSELEPSIRLIHLAGKIDTINTDKIFQQVVDEVENSKDGVLFNLKEVKFLSSAGLRMFLSAYKKASASNIKIAMFNVHPSVYKIFKLAGFDSAFKVFDDEPQALKEIWGLDNIKQ